LDELSRLEQVVPARGAAESPMLSTARAAAAARVHEAEVGVALAQESLASATQPKDQLAPSAAILPSDRPLTGPYRTYFDVIFANRPPVGRTREINRTLPLRLAGINDRTAAVQSATSAIHYAEEAHAKGEADLRTVLACHETLHRERRAF